MSFGGSTRSRFHRHCRLRARTLLRRAGFLFFKKPRSTRTESTRKEKPMEQITLYYRQGSSDKVYQASIAAPGRRLRRPIRLRPARHHAADRHQNPGARRLRRGQAHLRQARRRENRQGLHARRGRHALSAHRQGQPEPPASTASCSTRSRKTRSSGSSPTRPTGCRRNTMAAGCSSTKRGDRITGHQPPRPDRGAAADPGRRCCPVARSTSSSMAKPSATRSTPSTPAHRGRRDRRAAVTANATCGS